MFPFPSDFIRDAAPDRGLNPGVNAVSSALKTVEGILKAITRRLKRINGSEHWELSRNPHPVAERLAVGRSRLPATSRVTSQGFKLGGKFLGSLVPRGPVQPASEGVHSCAGSTGSEPDLLVAAGDHRWIVGDRQRGMRFLTSTRTLQMASRAVASRLEVTSSNTSSRAPETRTRAIVLD